MMKRKFTLPNLIALFLGSAFLIASMAPIPYRFAIAPSDQVYDGTEFWSDDYSAYVSYIIQGQQGKWLAYDTHTAEPDLPGIVIHDEYVLWGKLTGLFGIDPITAYHLFRAVLASVLIYLCWKLITLVFSQNTVRLTALVLLLFVGGFPSLDPGGRTNFTFLASQYSILSHIPWLTELDVFYRFVSLPHYLLGNFFFLLSLLQFVKLQKLIPPLARSSRSLFKAYCLLLLFGLGAGFTHAVSLVTLYLTFGLYFFLTSVIEIATHPKKAFQNIPLYLLQLTFYIALTSPILFYFKSLLTLSPWSNLSAAWEATNQYFVPLNDVILAVGPTFFLAPIGLFILLKYKTYHNLPTGKSFSIPLLLASWPIAFFLLFYFSHPFLKISQVRFFQSYFFISLALISAPVLVFIAQNLSRLVKTRLVVPIISSFLILVFVPTYPLFQTSFTGRFTFYSDFNWLTYPPKAWAEAIYWLKDHVSHDAVILCAWQCGHHLPFMSGNYVYLGHTWGTLDLPQKLDLSENFFRGQMTLDGARQFLNGNRISYVFWGYEEKNYGGNPEKFASLITPVYSSPAVTIFQVNN